MDNRPSDLVDAEETRPLLGVECHKPNPLPKLQLAIVLLLQVSESITGQSISPYIKQVDYFRRSREALLNFRRLAYY